MSTAEPDDLDAIFKRMVEDLNVAPEHLGVVNVSILDDHELLKRFEDTKDELRGRGEMLNPNTDTGRDLSALYHACLYECKKRKLL
jgi:hypothetical protein